MKEVKVEPGFPFTKEQIAEEATKLIICNPEKWKELELRAIAATKSETLFLVNMLGDSIMDTLKLTNPQFNNIDLNGKQMALVGLTQHMAHELFDYLITKQQSKEK